MCIRTFIYVYAVGKQTHKDVYHRVIYEKVKLLCTYAIENNAAIQGNEAGLYEQIRSEKTQDRQQVCSIRMWPYYILQGYVSTEKGLEGDIWVRA